MAILFRSSENEKQRARLCGGRIHVLGPSTDSDEPLHHEGSPLRTSAFSQGGHGTVLYVFGRPCTMVYAPGREYAFMEENGPVDHGRLRCTRCERGGVLPHPSAREGNTLVSSSSLHSLQWPSSSSIQKVPATRKPLILFSSPCPHE